LLVDPTTLESTPGVSFNRPETPPPPTAPVKSKNKDIKLVPEELPPIADHFTAGDELTDDWFGEDTVALSVPLAQKNDSDDEGPGNPMVLGDEDVEPIFYSKQPYQQQQSDNEEEDGDDDNQQVYIQEEEVVSSRVPTYQPPVFKSELNDVWSGGLRRLSGPEVVSDSDDEDNMMIRHQSIDDSPSFIPSPHASPYMESPSFGFGSSSSAADGGGGYEEIGGSNENPWSVGHHDDYSKNQKEEESAATWTIEQASLAYTYFLNVNLTFLSIRILIYNKNKTRYQRKKRLRKRRNPLKRRVVVDLKRKRVLLK
jgi:hypothetical protein